MKRSVSGMSSVIVLSVTSLVLACSSDPAPGTGSAGSAGSSAGGRTAAGGASAGGAQVSGGAPSSAGSGTAGASIGGAGAGNGGSSASGGNASGGNASGGSTANAGAAGSAVSACPANATFCSGFEVTTLPTGAVYKANAAPGDWSRDFAVDSTVFHGGKSSLRVKSDSEGGVSGAYRMLAVPAPMATFWVRFFMQQTDLDIGGNDHNVFASAAGSDEPNTPSVEFAEDVGISFNAMDVVRWPAMFGRTLSGEQKPFSLPKGMWHCIEISFDSQGRAQKLFINNTLQIDAPDYPATVSAPFKIFKFGFNQLHGPSRKVWYDDVAVAPTRINCF